jgi:hypothetical protein
VFPLQRIPKVHLNWPKDMPKSMLLKKKELIEKRMNLIIKIVYLEPRRLFTLEIKLKVILN